MTFPLLGYMCIIHLTKSPGAFDCPFSGNDSNDFIVASFFSFLLPGRVSTGCFESVQLTLYFVTEINNSQQNPSHEFSKVNSLLVNCLSENLSFCWLCNVGITVIYIDYFVISIYSFDINLSYQQNIVYYDIA